MEKLVRKSEERPTVISRLRSSIYKEVDRLDDGYALRSIYNYVLFIAQRKRLEDDRSKKIRMDMEQLLEAFSTDEISQEDIDQECEAVSQEMYEQGRQISGNH